MSLPVEPPTRHAVTQEEICRLIKEARIAAESDLGLMANYSMRQKAARKIERRIVQKINRDYALVVDEHGRLRILRLIDGMSFAINAFKILFNARFQRDWGPGSTFPRIAEFWLAHPSRLEFGSEDAAVAYLEKRDGK